MIPKDMNFWRNDVGDIYLSKLQIVFIMFKYSILFSLLEQYI